MPRFNAPVLSQSTATVNLAGGKAFGESAQLEFATILLTSFVKDQFYRKADATLERLRALMEKVSPLFAARAAVYARTQYNMRSITHVVAGEIAKQVKGERWTRAFFDKVAARPDDITEILAYYVSRYGRRPLPNSLKDGLGRALTKFSAYQLAKYRGEGKGFGLVDVVNLCHPKPTDASKEALAALMKGTLVSTDTWEARLTKAGQETSDDDEKANLKKAAWTELLAEGKLGYFALLRNLRNIVQQAPEAIPAACALLTDAKRIAEARVLPFRFQTAMAALEAIDTPRQVILALSQALDLAVANVPRLTGQTLMAVDESGSMQGQPIKIASLFAAVLYKTSDADLLSFTDTARFRTLNPADSVMGLASAIEKDFAARGTNFNAIFEKLAKPYDRIIILSDQQGWMAGDDSTTAQGGAPTRSYEAYKQRTGAKPKVFSFDLQGYGTLQFPQADVFCLAGFSAKVFDLLAILEQDKNALIKTIESVEL